MIRAVIPDSYHPTDVVEIDVHSKLPPMADTEALETWLAWRLGRVENHEMREWLRRDGKPIYDPHAPDGDRDL